MKKIEITFTQSLPGFPPPPPPQRVQKNKPPEPEMAQAQYALAKKDLDFNDAGNDKNILFIIDYE